MRAALRPLALALVVLAAAPPHAHGDAVRSVLGNGGTRASSSTVVLQGTVGQAAIGHSSGIDSNVGHGFWVYAGAANVGETPGAGLPHRFEIGNARPSPARGSVRFALRMPSEGDVQVRVFDATGRKVGDAYEQHLPAGTHSLEWSAAGGSPGVYFARFSVNGRTLGSRRIVLVR